MISIAIQFLPERRKRPRRRGHSSRSFEWWVYSDKLRWGPALWLQIQSCQGCFFLQVIEYLLDYHWVFNTGDESKAVLVCTLANGKITYIHRRLWPAFVRMAAKFPGNALDKVQQVHLPPGRHQRQDIPFPDWVSETVFDSARRLSTPEASVEIAVWLQRYGGA